MPLRRLAVSATIVTALLMLGGGAFAAPAEPAATSHLPAPCVAAGAKTEAECQALLHRAAPAGKPAAKAPQAPAAAEKPVAPKPEAAKPPPPKPEAAKPEAPKPAAPKPAASPAEPKPAAAAAAAKPPAAQSEAAGAHERPDCTSAEAAKLPACAGERQHRRGPNGAAAGAEPAVPAAAAKPEATPAAKPEPAAPAKPAPAAPAKPAPAAPTAAAPAAPAAAAKPAAPGSPEAGVSAICAAAGIDSASACRRYESQHHEKPGAEAPAQPAPAAPAKPAAPAAPAAPATPATPAPAAPGAAKPATPAPPATPATPPGAKGNGAPASPAAPGAPATPAGPAAGAQLPPECLAVGISTAAQCNTFQARRHNRGNPGAGQGAATDQQNPAGKQPLEPVAKLPPGVTNGQLAPLLDSAKQREIGGNRTPPSGKPAAAGPQAPPPPNDEAAQAKLRVRKAPPLPPPGATPVAGTPPTTRIQLPQDVTVVNQTVVNNTTVNNTTVNNNAAGVDNGPPGRPGRHGRPGGMPGAFPPPPGEPVPPDAREVNPIGLAIGAVLQLGDRLIVDSSGRDQYRMSGGGHDRTDYAQLSGNRYMETIYRPGGIRIVTIYDRDGDVLRRSRFDQDGHETVLAYFDYSRDKSLGQWQDPGASLPPLQLDENVNNYVLDASQADERSLQSFLGQPPVEPVPRLYSIDEVERSARLRDIMPRVELTDLTFDTGSATLAPDQVQELGGVADAMLALLQRNPAETFLVEGHTDAVGSPASNLVLSDARAAAVAEILTDVYHVPPENLATQGYGSEFLRIQTADAERLNRRVVVRRITPLVTIAQSDN